MSKILISPSILSADFGIFAEEAIMLENCGADLIHCDVMDGVFVPNLTFGMKMIKDLKKRVNIPLDVHLMIIEPERYVENFIKSGADYLTIHLEATKDASATLKKIRELGAKAGISIKPNTPVMQLEPYMDLVDLVLIMSVEPGFGGQKFMPNALEKISAVKNMSKDREIIIQVDGGINEQTAKLCIEAGANSLVAGSYIFDATDKKAVIEKLKIG